jgi:anti-sigma factor RsiW
MTEFGDVEVHLATCPECAGEAARYREVMAAVGSLRSVVEPVPDGLVDRVTALTLGPGSSWRDGLVRVLHDRRAHVAAASVGGALVGAGAIALLWWRTGRRAVMGPA